MSCNTEWQGGGVFTTSPLKSSTAGLQYHACQTKTISYYSTTYEGAFRLKKNVVDTMSCNTACQGEWSWG